MVDVLASQNHIRSLSLNIDHASVSGFEGVVDLQDGYFEGTTAEIKNQHFELITS